VIGLIFVAYYIQIYSYHNFTKDAFYDLEQVIPLYFNRFRYSMLAFAFARERIINGNNLDSFEFNS
jgi:hypothetical protein